MNKKGSLLAKPGAGTQPKWRDVKIKSAPKLGSVYWCQFNDAEHVWLPEMWKQRPVIIVGHRDLVVRGSCLAVPTSTDPQETNTWRMELPVYISAQIDGRNSWILCNHLVTISTSRLSQINGKVPRLKQEDTNLLITRIRAWLPSPRA